MHVAQLLQSTSDHHSLSHCSNTTSQKSQVAPFKSLAVRRGQVRFMFCQPVPCVYVGHSSSEDALACGPLGSCAMLIDVQYVCIAADRFLQAALKKWALVGLSNTNGTSDE